MPAEAQGWAAQAREHWRGRLTPIEPLAYHDGVVQWLGDLGVGVSSWPLGPTVPGLIRLLEQP